jgi:uncharacterized membrane protein HdeD (DUF308 family)
MCRIFAGALLVIAGIAAFIEAHSHRPEYECQGRVGACEHGEDLHLLPGHLTETPYDLLSIGAWALVIVGALQVIVGLIAYARDGR